MTKPVILFLSRWFPYPADNGARLRIYNVLRELSQAFEIYLISFWEGSLPVAGDLEVVRAFCSSIDLVPYPDRSLGMLRSLQGWLSARPRSVLEKESPLFRAAVQQVLDTHPVDAIIASQIDTAQYVLETAGPVLIMEELEVAAVSKLPPTAGRLRRLKHRLTVWKLSRYVQEILSKFACVTTVSEEEQTEIRRLAGDRGQIAVIPNGLDLQRYSGDFGRPEPGTLVYPGSLTFFPNFEAVCYLAGTILPGLKAEIPGVRLRVTGRTEGVELSGIAGRSDIELTGYLDDVRPVIAQSWACVTPIRQGGGTRLKILEALALGTPVITTAKGAEGLGLTDGEEIILAETPDEMIRAIKSLLSSPVLREKLSQNGRCAVYERFGWDMLGAELRRVVHTALDSNRKEDC